MADVHGSPASGGQMPQAMTPGPAPVPYSGTGQAAEPPEYGVTLSADAGGATSLIVAPLPAGNAVQESAYAHDVNAGLTVPYVAGDISPIDAHGDADAGGRDDVSATVAGAVAASEARFHEHEADTYGQGSTIGDVMTLPPSPLDPGVVGGLTDPEGAFYDPPRSY